MYDAAAGQEIYEENIRKKAFIQGACYGFVCGFFGCAIFVLIVSLISML